MHDDDAYSRDRREIGYGSIEAIQPVLDRLAATAPESLSPPVCIETFISLDGTKATIDLRGAELWDGGDDEWLVRVGGRFVLMHPDRPSREIEPEAATHWFRHHFGAQPLPDGFPPISRETPSLATWWRGEGSGADADPTPRTEATLPAPAVVPTARHDPEAEGGQQPAPEPPAGRPVAEPPAATAPGPAARPTHEIERESKDGGAGTIETDVPGGRERPTEVLTCPVEQAARMIGGRPRGAELLRYLNRQPDRKASLAEIAIALDGAREATAYRRQGTIRQRFNRTREALEREGAPVCLHIANGVVELVVPTAPPGHATPM